MATDCYKCLSLFDQTLGKNANDLKLVFSADKDDIVSWERQLMKHVEKSLRTLSKGNGLSGSLTYVLFTQQQLEKSAMIN